MKFQLFAFRRSKLEIIGLILIATFLLLNSTPGEALWGKKTKEISGEELKKIKAELNIPEDPRFHPYSDPDLKEVLDKEIDSQEAPGLTYGVFILNAINEEKLVDMCSKSSFNDKEASRFFSILADNLTSWQKNFAEKTTKIAIEAIIEAYKMHGLSIGTSSLFLAVDLAQIGVGIMKLAELVRNRALWFYIGARRRGDSHEVAWSVAGIPPLYDNWQTQEFFKSLWNKYEKHMSEDGLDKDFAQQEREKLRISFLHSLGAQAHPVISTPLKISAYPPYHTGDRINAEFTISNKGTAPITFSILTVGGRDPDDRVADFTFMRDITLNPNKSYNYKGSLTLAKAGTYHFFCAYQTPDGKWNPSVDLGSGLTDQDRVEDIAVKPKEETKPTLTEEERYRSFFSSLGIQKISPPIKAKDFTLENLEGSPVSLKDFQGKVVFLNFWATWCPPCRAEMPAMEKLWQKFKEENFVILAVDLREGKEKVAFFMKENGYTFPVLLDSRGEVANTYGITAVPTTYLLDPEGRTVGKALGARNWASEDALKLIKDITVKAEEETKPTLTIEIPRLTSRLARVKLYEMKELPVKEGRIFLVGGKEGIRVVGPEISPSPQVELELNSIFHLAYEEISKLKGGYIVRVNPHLIYDIAIHDFEEEIDLAQVELSKQTNLIKSNFIFLASSQAGGNVRVKITAIVNGKGVATLGPIGIEVRPTRELGVIVQQGQFTPITETLSLGLPTKVVMDFHTLLAKKNYYEAKKLLTPQILKQHETEGGLKQIAEDFFQKIEVVAVREEIEDVKAKVTIIYYFNGEREKGSFFLRKINNEWKIAPES